MERICYVVRHAESRYNAAVKSYSLTGMIGEKDHGLSTTGLDQCSSLRQRIVQAADQGDPDALAILNGPWLSSPLRRALATAALVGGATSLVALPDGREHCMAPVFARDSEGTPKTGIQRSLSRELGRDLVVDCSEIDDEYWWSVAETSASVRRRLASLLDDLYRRCKDQPAVFVGHSRVLRDLFKSFKGNDDSAVLAELGDRLVANCAVVKVSLLLEEEEEEATPGGGGVTIVKAELLFGTGFK